MLGAAMLPAVSADSVETFGRDVNESGTAIGWEFRSDGTAVAPVWPRAGGASLAIEPQPCDVSFGAFSIGDGINDRGDVLVSDDRLDASGDCSFSVWVTKLASGEEFAGPANGVARQLQQQWRGSRPEFLTVPCVGRPAPEKRSCTKIRPSRAVRSRGP